MNIRRPWVAPIGTTTYLDRYGDPGEQGPVCPTCAPLWQDRLRRADASPILGPGPYGGGKYRSPHHGTYLHEARLYQWQCTQGAHGQTINFPY